MNMYSYICVYIYIIESKYDSQVIKIDYIWFIGVIIGDEFGGENILLEQRWICRLSQTCVWD